jgi:hypothetical protein
MNSASKDPNLNSRKLYEISEIYSTMKINDTPEDYDVRDSTKIFPGFLADCFKSNENTMIEHENVSEYVNFR